MKKALALLLSLLMLVPAIAACGKEETPDTPDGDVSTTAAPTETTAPAETLPPELQDTLPEVKFTDKTFSILNREATNYDMFSEAITGDLVKDAVYERLATVQERFDVKLEVLTAPGSWSERDAFINRVSNSILADDHNFDTVMTHGAYLQTMVLRGLGLDLNTLPNLSFDKAWWCQQFVEDSVLGSGVYSMAGDISYTLYEYMECVYFNKTIAEQYQLPDLYAMVQNGEWTFDKMLEYACLVSGDLNNDSKFDSTDLYGLCLDDHNARFAVTYWETDFTVVGADGRRDFNVENNEKLINAYEKLYTAIYNNDQVYWVGGNGSTGSTQMFTNNQILFLCDRLSEAANMREMDAEYGIIPFPKYDTAQADYISCVRDALTLIMVPNNIEDPELVGTMLEALCMYGRTDIVPAYYETTLKLRYFNDPTSMEMLDTIRDNVTFDFACLYSTPLNLPYSFFSNQITNKSASIAAPLKVTSKSWQKLLDKMYDDFDALGK